MRKVLHAILLSLFISALGAHGATLGRRANPFVASAPLSSGGNQSAITYHTYANARFKYSIAYPAGILYPQGEADNGDGQTFLSRDGRAVMRVWGGHQLDVVSLKDMYEADLKGKSEYWAQRTVTMKVLKKEWYAISGYTDGRVFYQKTMLKGGVFKTFTIEYDPSQKSFYDPITARIARSFVG